MEIHCSPNGVIPKKNKPNKWRLIVDLSSPADHSVNDAISKEGSSFSYTSVDNVAEAILSMGKGSLLAKMDIKQAYRIVPIHPQDRPLLGMKWQESIYVDKMLPFGLRSAPLIFSALADALMWIMQKRGASPVFHYVDDFITVGRPVSSECDTNLRIMKETCQMTGTPIEEANVRAQAHSLHT
jgi:hypothetical protein